MNTVFLSVKYGRILKNTIVLENDQRMLKSFLFSLSYYFTIFVFVYSIIVFIFVLALKVDKISKTILENRKLPFSFSSLTLRTTGAAAAAQPENSILGEQ